MALGRKVIGHLIFPKESEYKQSLWQEKFQQRLRSGFLLRLKFNCLLPLYELELIGCRIDALPMGSHALQLTLWWRGVRPATEDWTAFFHITPSANNAEFVGQLDHAITDHEYPPTVWAVGEVVQEQVQISAAKLQAGSYAVCMGMYAPVSQMRAAVKAGHGVVVDNRAFLSEFQLVT